MGFFVERRQVGSIQQVATRYYFRQTVPRDLRASIGKTEFRISLRTSDKRDAKRRASYLYSALWNLFIFLRKETASRMASKLTRERINELVKTYIQQSLDETEIAFATRPPRTYHADLDMTPAEQEAEIYSMLSVNCLEQLETPSSLLRNTNLTSAAAELLSDASINVDKGSDEYAVLLRTLLRGQATMMSILASRRSGDYHSKAEQEFKNAFSPLSIATTPQHQTAPELNKDLRSVAQEYEQEMLENGKWTQRTYESVSQKIDFFIDALGNPKIKDITRDALKDTLQLLKKYPKNKTKSVKYRNMTLAAIRKAEIPEDDRLHNKTIEEYCIAVNAMFRKLARLYSLPNWYFETLEAPKSKQKEKQKARSPFTQDELQRIFDNDVINNDALEERYQFWLPVMALYTGARIGELSQLLLTDFILKDGVKCVRISEYDEDGNAVKRIKTASSARIIPLHPTLLDLGLWELVQQMQSVYGVKTLFPELKTCNDARQDGDVASKFFRRYVDRVCKIERKKGDKTMHSFRHTFANQCKQSLLEEKLYQSILGHSAGDNITEQHYTDPYNAKTLYEGIMCKLDFGIDLSHLKNSKHTRL